MSNVYDQELSMFQRIAEDLNNPSISPRKRERFRDEMIAFGLMCTTDVADFAASEAAKIAALKVDPVGFDPNAEPVPVVGAPEARLWARSDGKYDLALCDLGGEFADKVIDLYEDYLDAEAANSELEAAE
ncbi:hypothetical protein ACQKLX_10005 [Bosea sp. NPDC003192]|uniref:hypothetical protein n=1 Tax=Bosea sp. NPDC003192 TaxID=3390551 RepID=UPI003CFFEA96